MRVTNILVMLFLLGFSSVYAQQDVKVGDLYTFGDNTKGVVFYVDEEGHGLAVSTIQDKRRWEDESHYVYCQDIVTIPNELLPILDLYVGQGKINTSYILSQLKDVKPIAAKYCREEGSEWYLPSAGELYRLMVANADGTIDKTLKEHKYKKIEGSYWTSSEYGQGEAWRIDETGRVKHSSKLATRVYARAIRQF